MIYLNSLNVAGLNDSYFTEIFKKPGEEPTTLNVITMKDDDQAAALSSLIELFNAMAWGNRFPALDHDWNVEFEYEKVEFNNADERVDTEFIIVKVNCENGKITESAYEKINDKYHLIEGQKETLYSQYKSVLPVSVVNDLKDLLAYRWSKYYIADEDIVTMEEYFIRKHDEWYFEDATGYLEEMQAVLVEMFPKKCFKIDDWHEDKGFFEMEVERIGTSRNSSCNYRFFTDDSHVPKKLEEMSEEFTAFFLFYSEFKLLKDCDEQKSCFLFMPDFQSHKVIDLLTRMLHGSYEITKSQFFFAIWNDEYINEKLLEAQIKIDSKDDEIDDEEEEAQYRRVYNTRELRNVENENIDVDSCTVYDDFKITRSNTPKRRLE